MPELATTGPRSALPQINFQPINPSTYFKAPPGPLPADLTQAAKSQAHAAVMGMAAKTIADLPSQLTKAYATGQALEMNSQENEVKKQGLALKSQVLGGTPLTDEQRGAFDGITFGPDGSTSFKVESAAERDARIQALRNRGVDHKRNLYQSLSDEFDASGSPLQSLPVGGASAAPEGDYGKVTSYGYEGDEYGGPKAKATLIGPKGTPLSPTALAVSPDVEEKLKQQGFKLGDPIELTLSDGTKISRTWEDRTATDAEAKKLGLNPLRGRWDLRSTDGKSEAEGKRIIGFSRPGSPNQAVEPARRTEIESAAGNAVSQLSDLPLGNMSAENGPGPVPPAPITPASVPTMPVRRPTIGRGPAGEMIYAPTPDSVTAVLPDGTTKSLVTPESARMQRAEEEKLKNQPPIFATAQELRDHYAKDGLTAEIQPVAGGYVASKLTDKPKQTPSENALDRAVIARGKDPTRMTPDEKAELLNSQVPLRPSEKLSAIRDLRTAHNENPSTVLLYGKGQMPGMDAVFKKLEDIRRGSGGDFSKMSPQQARTMVFQFAKFNDPNSAVLLGEYRAAADAVGMLDKFNNLITKASSGVPINAAQALDIYNTVKETHDRLQADYVENAADIYHEAKANGINPRRVGITEAAEHMIEGKPATSDTQVDGEAKKFVDWLDSDEAKANPAKAAQVRAILKSKGMIQ